MYRQRGGLGHLSVCLKCARQQSKCIQLSGTSCTHKHEKCMTIDELLKKSGTKQHFYLFKTPFSSQRALHLVIHKSSTEFGTDVWEFRWQEGLVILLEVPPATFCILMKRTMEIMHSFIFICGNRFCLNNRVS